MKALERSLDRSIAATRIQFRLSGFPRNSSLFDWLCMHMYLIIYLYLFVYLFIYIYIYMLVTCSCNSQMEPIVIGASAKMGGHFGQVNEKEKGSESES